ncbi:TetR/AcrR family transcriptional regulator [uncultured Rikenella sp.]|uniref:TetR/AcrR family transcriptional regulator n=1 Tax=uncultured Rikenella sp. TaxID=368003 RepID=UPI0025F8600A|nr:TetR/AcrR family transcriptional regulator [uncultured Rikenella sp.]
MAVMKKEKHPAAQAIVPSGLSSEPSTRDTILDRSLELINESGMVDFRIDTLARSLGLSPGNITYHFSRKEDICLALWDRYLTESNHLDRSLTTLLDLRQYYLLNRLHIRLDYRYRGVVMFRSSDLGAMTRDREVNLADEARHLAFCRRAMQFLSRNGYLRKEASRQQLEDIHTCHYVLTRWCLNYGYQAYGADEVAGRVDDLALLSLHALYPALSDKGIAEFTEIMERVSADDFLGDPSLQ